MASAVGCEWNGLAVCRNIKTERLEPNRTAPRSCGRKEAHQVTYVCPACGYPNLAEEPRTAKTGGSYEICPSCGIQFGLDDEAGGNEESRKEFYMQWRENWIKSGSTWHSIGIPKPEGW